jgi:hypothetical protein
MAAGAGSAYPIRSGRSTAHRILDGSSECDECSCLLSVAEAEAAAAARLELDWTSPLRHMTFYKSVYRPAVLRANRLTPTAALSPELKFHSLRHTYASLCVAAGIPPLELSRFMGHSKVATTLGIYTHLFNTDDHADAMAALGAMEAGPLHGENVVPLWG